MAAGSEEKVCTDNVHIHLYPQKIYGHGRHGTVYAAKYYESDCVAKEMHHFKEEEAKEVSKAAFQKEMEIIQKLKHPNIVQLLSVCCRIDSPNSPILIMNKMSMTLNYFLKRSANKSHYLSKKVDILKDVACGLLYLHCNDIIHRDLTTNAIFLSEDFSAKIADFGQAKHFIENDKLTTSPGDLSYMPPEALVDNPVYTFKLDNFSFGCVVIHVITHKKPVPGYETTTLLPNGKYKRLSEIERRSEHLKNITDLELYELNKIVEKCLQDNPECRPNASDLLSMIQDYKATLSPTQESKLPDQSKMDLIDEVLTLQKLTDVLTEQCKLDNQGKKLVEEVQKLRNENDNTLKSSSNVNVDSKPIDHVETVGE